MVQELARKDWKLGWLLGCLSLICSLTILVWADDLETFRPNAAGTFTQLSRVGGTANWDAVDDVTSDGDTTYVYGNTGTPKVDSYNIPNFIGRGTINSVTVYVVAKKDYTGTLYTAYAYTALLPAGTSIRYGSPNQLTTSYVTYSTTYTTNPQSGAAWTWSAINTLEIGVRLVGQQTGYGTTIAMCTQVYAIIDYDYGEVIVY